MVVLLLVVVWLVALVPIALRKLSEWQVTASVARFRRQRRVMSKTLPYPPQLVGVRPLPEPRRGAGPAQSARMQRQMRERSARLMARRRRVLARLAGSLVVTLVLGAVPPLRFLWDVSLATFFLTSGYVALLVRLQQVRAAEAAEHERAEKVVPIDVRHRQAEASMPVGSSRHAATLAPTRPAYVLVDVPG